MATNKIPEGPGAYHLIDKFDKVIYVGHTTNLAERFSSWQVNPEQNPCVKRQGWAVFRWQQTSTVSQAQKLEEEWYLLHKPICNLIRP